MKKILTITAVLLTSTAVFSQDAPGRTPQTLSIGPAVGFGHTGIRNTNGVDLFKPYVSGGFIVNYSTSEHIGFAADVLWSREGALVENRYSGVRTDLTLNYIRVPLKFVYFCGNFEDSFRPKITVGPSLGFLLDATDDAENLGITDVTASYEMFDIGVNASIGFNLKLAERLWLNTDFNYYTGFLPIRVNQYNSNYGLRVGLAVGL